MDAMRKERTVRDDWLSVPQAARLLGCAHGTTLNRALRGELEWQIVAGRTVISRASVDRARGA